MAEHPTSLSFRGAAISGPAWTVIAAFVIAVLAGLAALSLYLGSDNGTDPSPATTSTPADVLSEPLLPYTYGDDAELDVLWDLCAAGALDACSDLYWVSDFGTEYESFGATCGGRESDWVCSE